MSDVNLAIPRVHGKGESVLTSACRYGAAGGVGREWAGRWKRRYVLSINTVQRIL